MNQKTLWLVFLGCLTALGAPAGERFLLKVTGECRTTSAAGEVAVTPLTSATLIQDCLGTTNNFVLVYDLGATVNADFLEVINTLNGEVFCIPFELYPPTVFNNFDGNFVQVTRADQLETRRIRYFFGPQSDHSVGTIYLTVKRIPAKRNKPEKVSITGEFQYFILPQGTNGVKICSGKLSATQKYEP